METDSQYQINNLICSNFNSWHLVSLYALQTLIFWLIILQPEKSIKQPSFRFHIKLPHSTFWIYPGREKKLSSHSSLTFLGQQYFPLSWYIYEGCEEFVQWRKKMWSNTNGYKSNKSTKPKKNIMFGLYFLLCIFCS